MSFQGVFTEIELEFARTIPSMYIVLCLELKIPKKELPILKPTTMIINPSELTENMAIDIYCFLE